MALTAAGCFVPSRSSAEVHEIHIQPDPTSCDSFTVLFLLQWNDDVHPLEELPALSTCRNMVLAVFSMFCIWLTAICGGT